MPATLGPEDFPAFFHEVHGQRPFPWQERLAAQLAGSGRWPAVLGLPTGAGKTAVLDVAVFHLALEAERGPDRRAPIRVALIVDRRLVVDDAFRRAERLARVLREAGGATVAGRVAARLRRLTDDGPPLLTARLRGGLPREDDWTRSPAQPTILCSTVDQVGSRLLFRGFGVSERARPIHAGLLGTDCHLFLDEAHLSEPFRQTLSWVAHYGGAPWREAPGMPWGVSVLTATPRGPGPEFGLEPEDHGHPVLGRRWAAAKPARLVTAGSGRADEPAVIEAQRVEALVAEAQGGLEDLADRLPGPPALAVVVNRVARARQVFSRLGAALPRGAAEIVLLIGPARPVERAEVVAVLEPIRTGAERHLGRPLLIVATQCIEAGVDLDLDGLVTDLAPLDALRQRFGRLNRDGRPFTPVAAVVAHAADIRAGAVDAVYGERLAAAWGYLEKAPGGANFGLAAFAARAAADAVPAAACSDAPDAPVLMPAHVDALARTAPTPTPDPELSLFLHGAQRHPASVSVIWRADVVAGEPDRRTRAILVAMPPRAGEAIALPVWAVRAWLDRDRPALADMADVPSTAPGAGAREARDRCAFRWAGDEDRSRWIDAPAIRPGDTIVVPSERGGVDACGWNPECETWVPDVADRAAASAAGRRFVVRVAPGLLAERAPAPAGEAAGEAAPRDQEEDDAEPRRAERLREILSAGAAATWRDLRDALGALPLPPGLRGLLTALDRSRSGRVQVQLDAYGTDAGKPRGVIFVAPFGLRPESGQGDEPEAGAAATEDDGEGSYPGFACGLAEHSGAVEATAGRFAEALGLPAGLVADIRLAALLHDAGKADPRFQAVLSDGDPLGPDPGAVLAKSAGSARRRPALGSPLPAHWRHEALSVRLAAQHPRFVEESAMAGRDPGLVLWLVGTHHGWGRPLFPHRDPLDAVDRHLPGGPDGIAVALPAGPGPQSLGFDWHGVDWAGLQRRLQARYGPWQLAWLEAIVRLADHRASERAARGAVEEEGT